jgi:hypothetical protein
MKPRISIQSTLMMLYLCTARSAPVCSPIGPNDTHGYHLRARSLPSKHHRPPPLVSPIIENRASTPRTSSDHVAIGEIHAAVRFICRLGPALLLVPNRPPITVSDHHSGSWKPLLRLERDNSLDQLTVPAVGMAEHGLTQDLRRLYNFGNGELVGAN